MSNFRKISPERARQIRSALNESRRSGKCLGIDKNSGECVGAYSESDVSGEKINALGKFSTHYA